MNPNQVLNEESVKKILGKVEIATIKKKILGKTLKQRERNYLYRSIRPKLAAANLLSEACLLQAINKHAKQDSSLIEYNLSLYGYQMLLLKKKHARKIPVEDLIINILNHPSARFIEAIPILLIKNKIDKYYLLDLACKFGVKNKLGYLIETANILKELPYLYDLLDYLKASKDEEISYLVEGDADFLMNTSPGRIRKWNLLGRFFDEDFRKLALTYDIKK